MNHLVDFNLLNVRHQYYFSVISQPVRCSFLENVGKCLKETGHKTKADFKKCWLARLILKREKFNGKMITQTVCHVLSQLSDQLPTLTFTHPVFCSCMQHVFCCARRVRSHILCAFTFSFASKNTGINNLV